MIIWVIAYFHGFEGVPMVGVFQCQHHGAFCIALIDVILQCHFRSNFYGNTAGIGEKAMVQTAGKPFRQFVRKLLHRLVGQTAQHHMGKVGYL